VATLKLTKKTIDALPIRDRVYIAYDNVLPGFGCRVTPNGARSWIVEYRPHGGGRSVGKRRITLGSVSVLTPDQAREAAGDVLAKVRFGDDGPHDRAARRSSPMLAELITEFMNEEIRPLGAPIVLGNMFCLGTRFINNPRHADGLGLAQRIHP
jgi:hypothetical protein